MGAGPLAAPELPAKAMHDVHSEVSSNARMHIAGILCIAEGGCPRVTADKRSVRIIKKHDGLCHGRKFGAAAAAQCSRDSSGSVFQYIVCKCQFSPVATDMLSLRIALIIPRPHGRVMRPACDQ